MLKYMMDQMECTTLVAKLNLKLQYSGQVYTIIKYIFAKGTKIVPNTGIAAAPNNRNKKLIFRNFAPFTDCISQINNKRIDHANDIDIVMQMHNLIEYNDYYSKTSASLWQYYRDEACINNNGVIIDVLDDPDSASLKCKQKITSQTGNDGIKDVQIMLSLKNI